MLDTFGFPTPQGANYQAFYGGGTIRDWVKPRGASMVRMLLIGAGAGGTASAGGGGTGGSSGAVTQWIGPAIFIPDVLRVSIGTGGGSSNIAGTNTEIIYQSKDGTGYTLLTANGGSGNTGAPASANNYFGAAGIYKSTAGHNGALAATSIIASTTVFLSGGAGGSDTATGVGGNVACNYGYPTILGGVGTTGGTGGSGIFITQPIMLSAGGAGGGGSNTAGGKGGNGGIGCGGGGGGRGSGSVGAGGRGGDGAAFFWSW